MTDRPRVALFVESSTEFGRLVLGGIRRYLHTHRPWSIYLQQRDLNTKLPEWINNWEGSGIISRSTSQELARVVLRSQIPFVDLTDRYGDLGLPRIWVDHEEIGRIGATHLIERQFRQFAFAGFKGEYWSDLRYQGFSCRLAEHDFSSISYNTPWETSPQQTWDDEFERLIEWLNQLPKPIGIMACNDVRGQQIIDACCEAKLAVPEQVAVLGCDNDMIRCQLCDPPLSSVVPNAEQIGYEAAQMLDQQMNDRPLENRQLNILPQGIETRRSTDILAIDDPQIATAVRVIREQALFGLKVEDLVRIVSVSRSTLERGIRRYLKRSPQSEIRRVQLKYACELLRETDLTLPQIAERCGFEHSEYFSVVFKREFGIPPGKYRTLNSIEHQTVHP